MLPVDTVMRFLKIFFSGNDYDDISYLLNNEFLYESPIFSTESAEEYINRLKNSPRIDSSYTILKIFNDSGFINIIYEYKKGEIATPVSQLFELKDGKISTILLIYDKSKVEL